MCRNVSIHELVASLLFPSLRPHSPSSLLHSVLRHLTSKVESSLCSSTNRRLWLSVYGAVGIRQEQGESSDHGSVKAFPTLSPFRVSLYAVGKSKLISVTLFFPERMIILSHVEEEHQRE